MKRYTHAWIWLGVSVLDFAVWLIHGIEGHWSFLRFLVAGFALLLADYERQTVRLNNEIRDLSARVQRQVTR